MMGFWIFLFVCNLLIPVMMIAFGGYFTRRAPQEINGVFGYRTTRSMKNKDTWKFAHHCCGKIWWTTGWILLVVTGIGMLLLLGRDKDVVGTWGAALCMVQCGVMVFTIFPVERALKRTFDDQGRRK